MHSGKTIFRVGLQKVLTKFTGTSNSLPEDLLEISLCKMVCSLNIPLELLGIYSPN